MSDHASHADHGDDLKTAYTIFGALMLLLVVTVGIAYVELGVFTLPVAMGIAIVKAWLILVYFMHLKYESTLVRVFAVSGFVSLAILFAITFADYLARFPSN